MRVSGVRLRICVVVLESVTSCTHLTELASLREEGLGPCKSDRKNFGPISVRFYFFLGEYLIAK